MKKILIGICALALSFDVLAGGKTGACYVFYQIGNNPEVTTCEADMTEEACKTRAQQIDWQITKDIEKARKNSSWMVSHKWWPEVSCR